MERKMIQVDKDVAEAVKLLWPDLSWSSILRLLLDTSPQGTNSSSFATKKDLSALKEKFAGVLDNLIKQNNLKIK